MAESVLLGMAGSSVVECAYVESDIAPGVEFFAHKVLSTQFRFATCLIELKTFAGLLLQLAFAHRCVVRQHALNQLVHRFEHGAGNVSG